MPALPVQSQQSTTGPAYQIFARARNIWSSQQYPAYLSYTVVVDVHEKGVEKAKHYHLAYDVATQKIYVNPISDEEHAAPPTPTGISVHLLPKRQNQTLMDKRVGNPGEAVDYLGVPMISPTYSFGMSGPAVEGQPDDSALIAQIRKEYNDPVPAQKAKELATSGKLKTVADVTSHLPDYTVTQAPNDQIDGHDTYHLLLKPTHDPQQLRLRELWVDTTTYETRKLISAGNFAGSTAPWLITFGDVNGALYISSESAEAPVGFGDHRYESASVTFESIAPTSQLVAPAGWFITKQNIMSEPGGY